MDLQMKLEIFMIFTLDKEETISRYNEADILKEGIKAITKGFSKHH